MSEQAQGPIKQTVFLVSTKRAFYLIGVPVGSGMGCKEGTAEGSPEGGGEGSSEGGKWGLAKASAWLKLPTLVVSCRGSHITSRLNFNQRFFKKMLIFDSKWSQNSCECLVAESLPPCARARGS